MAKGLDYDNDVIHQQDGTRWIIFRWTTEQLEWEAFWQKHYPVSQTVFHIVRHLPHVRPLKISLIWVIF